MKKVDERHVKDKELEGNRKEKLLEVKELKEEMEVENVEVAYKVAACGSRIPLAATYNRLVNDQGSRKTFCHGDSGERLQKFTTKSLII